MDPPRGFALFLSPREKGRCCCWDPVCLRLGRNWVLPIGACVEGTPFLSCGFPVSEVEEEEDGYLLPEFKQSKRCLANILTATRTSPLS
ncbi:hypothetical protein F0562_036040 [Nyssa sinensis]|uniref:Uncharacterized protein n=1 Tax=Nyssa sinensis TaxID=561372 RepID=A0A5J5ACC8_9ASTE|nr:hypothetical protein F0562_036040 [Nyssa sinensis]